MAESLQGLLRPAQIGNRCPFKRGQLRGRATGNGIGIGPSSSCSSSPPASGQTREVSRRGAGQEPGRHRGTSLPCVVASGSQGACLLPPAVKLCSQAGPQHCHRGAVRSWGAAAGAALRVGSLALASVTRGWAGWEPERDGRVLRMEMRSLQGQLPPEGWVGQEGSHSEAEGWRFVLTQDSCRPGLGGLCQGHLMAEML